MRVRDVMGPDSPLSRILPGYEHRAGQMAMAEAVEQALDQDRPLMVEAGTGTGKTLAYLVPALLSGKTVVVSTATRALQEQIFAKDLPLITRMLATCGVQFRAVQMKGLANYLCKRRYEQFRQSSDAMGHRMLPQLERWAATTRTGDRAELADVPEEAPIWSEVQSSTETRIGADCRYYDECFVTRMRREAEQAQLIIVNHDLFLADLALRTGPGAEYASAIPNYDAVIFDEAHQIEDIATEFFGVRVSSARFEALDRDAKKALDPVSVRTDVAGGADQARSLLAQAEQAAKDFFWVLVASAGDGRRVLTGQDWGVEADAAFHKLDACMEAIGAFADEHAEHEALLLVGRRARELRAALGEIARGAQGRDDEPIDGQDPSDRVTWIDVRERSVAVGSSPVDLGPTLRTRLFDRVPCVVCTSATLATSTANSAPSFVFIKERLGAPPDANELVVSSPFDYASRAALYVPRDLPEPNAPSFERAAAERIEALVRITDGGAFVLCTSVRSMNALHRALSLRLDLPLLRQGQAPKHLLLSRFRASGRAVLVATMSFWEGVDVPGHALRLVILDKIPFAVPTDPVVQARCAKLEQNGGNPFTQYSVPSAAITLKQGFGRLLRTQRDAGIVAVLDRRMLTKPYGRALLASLPPARRAHALPDVRKFFEEVNGQGAEREAASCDLDLWADP